MTPSTIPAIEAGDMLLMTEGGVSIRSLVATEDVGPGTVAISQLISVWRDGNSDMYMATLHVREW